MKKTRSGYTKKRKFYGNRHTTLMEKRQNREVSPARVSPSSQDPAIDATASTASASARKIGTPQPPKLENSEVEAKGFRFIDLAILSAIFNMLPCRECQQFSLQLIENLNKLKGCASSLVLRCNECNWNEEFYTSGKINYFFEVNRRLVYAMRSIECGASSTERFCGLMNMPKIPTSAPYAAHNKAILKAAKQVCHETMIDAAKEIHVIKNKSPDEVVDCGVSCDGTWQRRGFSSLNGCVATISMDTGKVLDVEVLTKFCKECKKHENDDNSPKNIAWKTDHKAKCKINFEGSAPAMEREGARRIFERSVDEKKIRYTEYFGDGDSKSYAVVQNVYNSGDDGVEVVKKECVGHVQKRVGTALRKLRKESKGLGGKGKLTDKIIDKLQNYYGIAIRSNPGNLEEMKKAILASLFHCASSEGNKWHTAYCPAGENSWCGFMRDKAKGTNEYKHGKGLPIPVVTAIKPIYARLSNDELLVKCLDCKTQNQNESFNGMVWNRLPKQVFVGSDVLHLGVYDAVSHFNIGASAAIRILEKMGISSGDYCTARCLLADKQRIQSANKKSAEKTKTRRKIVRASRKAKGDKQKQAEGETYACGEF